ncbi:BTAD domain-containing putative transcriptional regulator [Azospirillum sp.]|uniref:BTAD domain-containing putative transcriptional regulator n=1 Tax=Azospirillum sp. TaxID=34012 RepID=UPI002D476875|nr:BTAD domain-containing putative transcriptional regulator [Azospirillum sp.]HYD68598.1 BTAD domain-containing putative transcriptional regulator [Azospirillum sp.]
MDGPTLRLLGGFALTGAGGRTLPAPGRKAQALLAHVALIAPKPLSRERLAGLLWEERDEARARHSLRQCLMELRRLGVQAGGDLILTEGDALVLALPADRVDALALDRLAGEGSPESLHAAADLCTGALLPEGEAGTEAYDAWLAGERARVARLTAGVFARLTALHEVQGDWDDVASTAERWLALDPACEEAHRSLMRAHAQTGRRSDAVRQYQICAEAVRRCLDAEPEEETVELLRSIRDRPPAATAAAAVATRTVTGSCELERRGVPDRPSLAVLPFATLDGPAEGGGFADVVFGDGLAHDVLARLARLRPLFVIAGGSSFRFRGPHVDPRTVGRALGVRYLVAGTLRTHAGRLRLTVELVEAETANAVWSEVFERRLDDVFAIQEDLATHIAAALEAEVESAEVRRALTRPPASLDAWGAYHRGLWHMFRFTRDDNETARGFFQRALHLDPMCGRAHAGLSFTHFQDAFLHRTADRRREAGHAYRFAEQSVALDERDPMAHWVLGRALWLLERQDDAVEELGLAVDLNPNFALGHYTIAFVQSQGGDARAALDAADLAQRLSPFDPLLFGMLGSRALALMNLRDYAEAAVWGERAARRPNAHVHIHAVAAFADALAERTDEARAYAHRIREAAPAYRCSDFLQAFRTLRPPLADLIRHVGPAIGIPP